MRAYLAGRFDRGPQLHKLIPDFNAAGYEVTARWLERSLQPLHETQQMLAHECAQEDMEDIDDSEIVFFFTEEPNQPVYHSGGRHVEFGYALAKGKRLIIVGPRENVFHHLSQVAIRFSDMDVFQSTLAGIPEIFRAWEGRE